MQLEKKIMFFIIRLIKNIKKLIGLKNGSLYKTYQILYLILHLEFLENLEKLKR